MRVSSVMPPGIVLRHVEVGASVETRRPARAPGAGEIGEADEGELIRGGKAAILAPAPGGPSAFTPNGPGSHVPHREADPTSPLHLLAKDPTTMFAHAPPDAPRSRTLIAGLGAATGGARSPGRGRSAAVALAAGRLATAGARRRRGREQPVQPAARSGSTSRSPAASPRRGCRWSSSARTRGCSKASCSSRSAPAQVVSGFALDIDSARMRDAVPCGEGPRRAVLEDITRRAASALACCRRRSATTTSCASIRSTRR